MIQLDALRIFLVVSVVIYFAFDAWDGRGVKDEREELIRLKTLELMQRLTLGVITFLCAIFLFGYELNAVFILILLVLVAMYGEIAGKLFFRSRL